MIFRLPFSLYESGIILGSIILVITCGLSIIACTFIIEALAIQNAFLKEEMLVLDKANDQRRNTTISGKYKLKFKTFKSSNFYQLI